jgi:RecQ-mediated genome instability protein 1
MPLPLPLVQPAPEPVPRGTTRAPLQAITQPPVEPERVHHSDDENQPRRRKVPKPNNTTTSAFFSVGDASSLSSNPAQDAEVKRILALSPPREGPIIINSDSEDDLPSPSSLISSQRAALGNNSNRNAKPRAGSPLKESSKIQTEEEEDLFPPSEDSFWKELDEAEIARIENDALNGKFGSMRTPSQDPNLSMPSMSRAASSSEPRAQSAGPSQPRAGSSSSGNHTVSSEVITIEDDDEDDKENVPAPTRHVRRRTARQMSTDHEIIDISD